MTSLVYIFAVLGADIAVFARISCILCVIKFACRDNIDYVEMIER